MTTEHYRYVLKGRRAIKSSLCQIKKTQHQHRVGYLPGLEIREARSHGQRTAMQLLVTLNHARIHCWLQGQPEHCQRIQARFTATDRSGSHTLGLDTQGKILSKEIYYPWGGTACWAVRYQYGSAAKTRRYAGKERDASGLVYYGFRYYTPWLRRWINPDPLSCIDGVNLYCFVCNNPSTLHDSDGCMTVSDSEIHAASYYADYAYHRDTAKTVNYGKPASEIEQKIITRMADTENPRFSQLSWQGQPSGITGRNSGMVAFIFHEDATSASPERYVVSFGGTSSGSYASRSLGVRMWENRSIWRRQMSANVANFFGKVPRTYKDADKLVSALMKEIPASTAVTITGHSLGAAAASYAAGRNFSRGWPLKMIGFSPAKLGTGAKQGALSGLDADEKALLGQSTRLIYIAGDPIPACCARKGGHLVPPMVLPRPRGSSTLSSHILFAAQMSVTFRPATGHG